MNSDRVDKNLSAYEVQSKQYWPRGWFSPAYSLVLHLQPLVVDMVTMVNKATIGKVEV